MASSLIIMSSVMVLALVMALGSVASQAEARAFFVFGDSLVDNGQQIGSEFLLPYLSPQLTGKKLLVGANFASAGIGILNDTGIQFASIIRMFQQFDYFKEYQRSVTALIGAQITKQLANGALVLITVGGNDFVNNYYFVPNSIRSRQYNLPDYVKFLISEYKKILMLYDLGARKVLVTGTGSLGCVPAELAMRSRNGQCAAELQRAASLFNPQLIQMIGQLNRQYRSNIFIAANTRKMSADFINNPGAFGFITAKVACCGQGPYNGIGLCTPTSNLCPNRDVFAFWDPFHPAERANRYIVQQILRGTNEYMNPMNLSTILALDFRT
ncbi:GDSL esterase/lipase At5g33370 isoform X2 [Hevea brasiliensis]|uniref:GDSL esterase/lipase At5g33370 isoform X2 n=1 Tax=Hevea brasiliensis TaxID=3981 RepID=UPI0025E9D7D5|nr:GDSL esterase/lipase At5g33370 isoform X2 [Hevea brasiliensis]